MLKKIYQEFVEIRKELQAIKSSRVFRVEYTIDGKKQEGLQREMDKRRAERKKELSMHVEDKDNIEDFKIEYGRAIPIIEGIRILNELKERGIENYEDVRKISEVLEILARGF